MLPVIISPKPKPLTIYSIIIKYLFRKREEVNASTRKMKILSETSSFDDVFLKNDDLSVETDLKFRLSEKHTKICRIFFML